MLLGKGNKKEDAKKDVKVQSQKMEKEKNMDAINVIQKKIIQNKNKVELFPAFGMSLNDQFIQSFSFSGALGFHLQETFSIEIFGGYIPKPYYKDAARDLPRDANLMPELSAVKYLGDLNFHWSTISCKFSFLDWTILYFEFYLTPGVGYMATTNSEVITANIGIGQKYYLSSWLAFRFEIKDHIYTENYDNIVVPNKNDETSKNITNFVNLYMGISLFFP
jgi:outer membrane beta-barrel protein